ncbi:Uncharacterised protein [Citrobacter koseri]|nr:Uncharacterised protein [Citrobacter koseri]
MAEPLLLAQYHDAVIGALKKIEWVRDADAYPEKKCTALFRPGHARCLAHH